MLYIDEALGAVIVQMVVDNTKRNEHSKKTSTKNGFQVMAFIPILIYLICVSMQCAVIKNNIEIRRGFYRFGTAPHPSKFDESGKEFAVADSLQESTSSCSTTRPLIRSIVSRAMVSDVVCLMLTLILTT